MKVSIIDKDFFNLFKKCPKAAVYSYAYKSTLSDGTTNVSKEKTMESYMFSIFSTIMTISILQLREKGTIPYKDFKNIVKVEINRRLNENENEILEPLKEGLLKTLEFEYSSKLYNMLEAIDFENISVSSIRYTVDLNDSLERMKKNFRIGGTNYSLQKKYHYNYEIPFITKDINQYNIIKFTNSGVETTKDVMHNYDLAICLDQANVLFPKRIFKGIIVYDLKTFTRSYHKVSTSKFGYVIEDLYKTITMVDTNICPRNHSDFCNSCINQSACTIYKLDTFDRNKLYHRSLKGYRRNELEKRQVIDRFIENLGKDEEKN